MQEKKETRIKKKGITNYNKFIYYNLYFYYLFCLFISALNTLSVAILLIVLLHLKPTTKWPNKLPVFLRSNSIIIICRKITIKIHYPEDNMKLDYYSLKYNSLKKIDNILFFLFLSKIRT